MKKDNIFYLIFILTILSMRLGVFLFPTRKLIISGVTVHHFWVGVILIFLVMLLAKRYNGLRMAVFSAGSGLTADELIYIILGGKTVNEYWSVYSVSGVIIMAAIVFVIRKWLIRKII